MTVWGDWVLSVFYFVSTILKILQYFQGSTGMTKESLFSTADIKETP